MLKIKLPFIAGLIALGLVSCQKEIPFIGGGLDQFHNSAEAVYEDDSDNDDQMEDACVKAGDFRTQTPGGWGAPARGNNPGVYRDANFDAAFPGGLVVGDATNYTLTLSSAKAVEEFLPSGGKPSALTESYVDPAGALNNTLGSHVVSLTLSVTFDAYDADFGGADNNLGDLVFAAGSGFEGLTVAEVLAEANTVLGGGASVYSASELTDILSKVNESFVDGNKISGEAGTLFECPGDNEDPGEDPEEPNDEELPN